MLAFAYFFAWLAGGAHPVPLEVQSELSSYQMVQQIFQTADRPIDSLQTHTETFPSDPWGHHFLASALLEVGKLDRAKTSILRSMALDGQQSFHSGLHGKILESLADFSAAAEAYRRAAELDERPQVRQNFGERAESLDLRLDSSSKLLRRTWLSLALGLLAISALVFLIFRSKAN